MPDDSQQQGLLEDAQIMAVRAQLDRLLQADDLRHSPSLQRLLRHIVEATLAGDGERLKGYTLGIEVYDRGAEFDPNVDPIVRIEAGRLRSKLLAYYSVEGAGDAVRIDVPEGSYKARFAFAARLQMQERHDEGRQAGSPPGLAAESGPKRRLMAILVADAAGYSRLMSVDESATIAALDAARQVFRRHVEANQGRISDTAGDSVLAVFETATGAVLAALAVQADLAADDGVPQDRQLRFRIGLHLGDIFEKGDGAVYGDGVNIAARFQSLAKPGEVTASDAIESAVRGKQAAQFVDCGEHHVKNIPHSLHAFTVHTGGDALAPAATLRPALRPPADRASIAVLPFVNMSDDPAQDYFADGMVEEIITALARMGLFFVIARSSTFAYKGKAVDVKQVGRELGVRYVLEGSVRKSGDRVRITGQLIECENGTHVWADRFDGRLDQVFELQDQVGGSIVAAMEPNMRRVELQRVRGKPTTSLQAYDLVLRSLPGLLPAATSAGRDEALSFIRLALQKDPHYSRAMAFGAFLCMRRIAEGEGDVEDVKAGLRFAEEALSAGSDDASALSLAGCALAALGFRALGVRVLGFRYEEARRAIERALDLSPHLQMVQWCAGMVQGILGEGDAACAHFEHAMRLSPLDPAMSGFIACQGAAHLICGRYEQALDASQRALQDSPNFVFALRTMVMALGHLGRIDEATQAVHRLRELAPRFTVSLYRSTSPVKDRAFRNRAAEIMLAAGVPK